MPMLGLFRHIGPEKHFRESGINRQVFGLQKQIRRGIWYYLGLYWYCDAFGLGWGFSCVLAWFGRDLALAVGVFKRIKCLRGNIK